MAITLFLGNLREHCAGASVYMMGLFYTTVGLGFRLDQARTVSGPVGALIGVTLVSHLCVILSGSLVWNFLVKSITGFVSKMEVRSANSTTDSSQDLLIDLDTTIIARYNPLTPWEYNCVVPIRPDSLDRLESALSQLVYSHSTLFYHFF